MYSVYTALVLGLLTWSFKPVLGRGRCYEEVDQHALFLNNARIIRDVSSLDACEAHCDEETSFACISLDYTSTGTCYLSDQSHLTDPDMYGPHYGATYASVIECTGRCYAEEQQMALYLNNDRIIRDVGSVGDCEVLCDEETSFNCSSLDYIASGTCFLSGETHLTQPDMYGPHLRSTYASVVDCPGAGSEESEEESGAGNNGRCYRVYKDMFLFAAGTDLIFDLSVSECMKRCDAEVAPPCVAVNRMGSATCQLSYHTHEAVDDILFDKVDNAVYAMVVECDAGLPDIVTSDGDTLPDWVYIDDDSGEATSNDSDDTGDSTPDSVDDNDNSGDDDSGFGSGSGSGSGSDSWFAGYDRNIRLARPEVVTEHRRHPPTHHQRLTQREPPTNFKRYKFFRDHENEVYRPKKNTENDPSRVAIRDLLNKRYRHHGK